MASEVEQMSEKIFDSSNIPQSFQKAQPVKVDQKAMERESKKIEKHQEKIIKETEEEMREKKRQGMVRRYMARINHPEIGPGMRACGFKDLSGNCTFEQAETVTGQMEDYDKKEGKEALGLIIYKMVNKCTEKFFVTYMQKQAMDHFAEFADNNVEYLQPNFAKVCLDIPDWMVGGPFMQLMVGYYMMIELYQKGDYQPEGESSESKEKEEQASSSSSSQWNSSTSPPSSRKK